MRYIHVCVCFTCTYIFLSIITPLFYLCIVVPKHRTVQFWWKFIIIHQQLQSRVLLFRRRHGKSQSVFFFKFSIALLNVLLSFIFIHSNGDNSGSFIKEKLIHPAVSCIEAINDKYGKVEDDLAGVDEEEAYLTQGEGGRVVKVEVVGMKDINDLQR